ncbi:MAG: DUF2169 domain-containing protein [Myxococcales bacterium]|nr:DUF2169 domain-containing protein [Myxococcales bacterium]
MIIRRSLPVLFAVRPVLRGPGKRFASVVVRGRFTLGADGALSLDEEQGALSSERYDEADLDRRGAPRGVDDFAFEKPFAEVLVEGRCWAPGGRATPQCPVRVSLGGWSKSLRVVGPRAYSDRRADAALSAPEPFVSMPLVWSRAWGGSSFRDNPVGVGLDGLVAPNLEAPEAPLSGRDPGTPAACFAPRNPAWWPRARHLGRAYGARWRAAGGAGYADDFDPRYFQCAPEDQWLETPLRGDEPFALQNLHPERPLLEGRLPGLGFRAIFEVADEGLRALPLTLDTVLFEPDALRVTLTWRGHTPVADPRLRGLTVMLLKHHAAGQALAPASSFLEEIQALRADPLGVEATLRGALPPDEAERALHLLKAPPSANDPQSATLKGARAALTPREAAALDGALRDTEAAAAAAPSSAATPLTEAAPGPPEAPLALPLRPGALPDLRLRAKVRAMLAQVERLKAEAQARDAALSDAALGPLEALVDAPAWRQLDPEYTPPGPLSTEAPGPGANLFERDFTDARLDGVDLRGATLDGAVFTRASLRGAVLDGASLHRAVFYEADLSGASLRGARLTQLNAQRLVAHEADFTDARLDGAHFGEAQLRGARFVGARGDYVAMLSVDAPALIAAEAHFTRSDFSGANLAGARFEGATLRSTSFEGATLEAARFTRAALVNARLVAVKAGDAVFRQAELSRANLSEGRFARADFRLARLRRCLGHEGVFDHLRAAGADFAEARFEHASLRGATLDDCNFFEASLAHSALDGASFRRASLYGADLREAAGRDTDFLDAKLYASTLDPERR